MAPQSTRKKSGPESFVRPVEGAAKPWFRQDRFLASILVAALLLAYWPVYHAGYIWDDDDHLTANPSIVGPLGLKEIWTTSASNITPLTRTTFWLEHKIWGLDPMPYHLVNVLLHAACALLLWRILWMLAVPGAWLGAILWALHPVEVESVAWISEMKNTESGLFFLLSILCFLRYRQAHAIDPQGGQGSYAGTFLFAALAMACKSTTVILPLVLWLCSAWLDRRWSWRQLLRVAPLFALSAAATALSIWIQRLQFSLGPMTPRPWLERLAGAGSAVWFYLGKLAWPHPLVMIYPSWSTATDHPGSLLALLALLAMAVLFWWKRDTWARPWFFTLAYFIVALLPTLGLVNSPIFGYSLVFDHFQYLASMAPLALLGVGLTRLGSLPGGEWPRRLAATALLLIFAVLSWQRTWAYENEATLWTDTLAQNPACATAYNGLANVLLQAGQCDLAIADLHRSIQLNPDLPQARYNLGRALLQQGRLDPALAEFQAAVRIDPGYAPARNDLAYVLFKQGRLDAAIAEFERAIQSDPNLAEIHYNLGLALADAKRPDEAIAQYQIARQLNPDDPAACNGLGILYLQSGRLDQAAAQFQTAIQLNPAFIEARNNLALVLEKLGRLPDAVAEYQNILAHAPQLPAAHYNLGVTYLQMSRMDDAESEFETTLELNPQFLPARLNLGQIFLQKGRLREAETQFRDALQISPNNPSALTGLARAQHPALPK
jgi:tetratricopeptide (TPR) repeat protein